MNTFYLTAYAAHARIVYPTPIICTTPPVGSRYLRRRNQDQSTEFSFHPALCTRVGDLFSVCGEDRRDH